MNKLNSYLLTIMVSVGIILMIIGVYFVILLTIDLKMKAKNIIIEQNLTKTQLKCKINEDLQEDYTVFIMDCSIN
jgi:uncharacterized protein involved in outer membrane biogenesis